VNLLSAVSWFEKNWQYIVGAAATITATTGWIVNVLRVRELSLQLERLRREAAEKSQRIHTPTSDEVEMYGRRDHEKTRVRGGIWLPVIVFVAAAVSVWRSSIAPAAAVEEQRAVAETASADARNVRARLVQVLAEQSSTKPRPRLVGAMPPRPTGDKHAHSEHMGIVPLIDLTKEPQLVFYEPPPFPVDLRREMKQEFMVLSVLINSEGRVLDVDVLTTASPEAASAATRAVRKWRYSPGERNGQRVTTRILQAITSDSESF